MQYTENSNNQGVQNTKLCESVALCSWSNINQCGEIAHFWNWGDINIPPPLPQLVIVVRGRKANTAKWKTTLCIQAENKKSRKTWVFSKFWSKIFQILSNANLHWSKSGVRLYIYAHVSVTMTGVAHSKSEQSFLVSDERRTGDMVSGWPAWWGCRRSMGWRWNGCHPHPAALFCRQTWLHYQQTWVRAGNLSPWINFVRIKCMSLASLTGSVCVCVCVVGWCWGGCRI